LLGIGLNYIIGALLLLNLLAIFLHPVLLPRAQIVLPALLILKIGVVLQVLQAHQQNLGVLEAVILQVQQIVLVNLQRALIVLQVVPAQIVVLLQPH